jgi:hypothetical protein
MPGLTQTYNVFGKRGRRRTPYRYVGARELDFYNFRLISKKLRLNFVDTFALMAAEKMRSLGMEPWTPEVLERLSRNG